MIDKVFIDTNLLIYSYNNQEYTKHIKINLFLDEKLLKNKVYTSTQVRNEFYSLTILGFRGWGVLMVACHFIFTRKLS